MMYLHLICTKFTINAVKSNCKSGFKFRVFDAPFTKYSSEHVLDAKIFI